MTPVRRACALGILAAVGLAVGTTSVAAVPAVAAVTCPTVNPSTGAVTPSPSPDVDWAGCDLDGAYLPGADLEQADLQDANLTEAYLTNADLTGTNLAGATTTDATISGNLSGADFASATLTDANLNGANLRSADLDDISAFGTSFVGDPMEDARLQGADLGSTDLGSADLFGATLTNATENTTTIWDDATCPNGASANYYTGGCLGTVSVTTPSATPTITGGTPGNNGWYTSGVTVSWYWVDSNSLESTCPNSTTSAVQGSAVVISASCADSDGNVGTGSLTVKVDASPPVVKLTGVRNGSIYMLGEVPTPTCTTTDAISGVAEYAATYVGVGGRPDGSGVSKDECVGGKNNAGLVAPTISASYTVVYAFDGFLAPRPSNELNPKSRKITVEFRLDNAAGETIPASTMAALASGHDVRATLRGPDTKPVVSRCNWNGHGKFLECLIITPRKILSGRSHKYSITVTENVGSGFLTALPDAGSENPVAFHFK